MKIQFSKLLILFETALVGYLTYEGVSIAKLAIENQMDVVLPWITAMVTASWAAYGFSAKYYYSKSLAENCKGGITYDKAFKDVMGVKDDSEIDE